MGHPLHAVEADIVLVGVAPQHLGGALAKVPGGAEFGAEIVHCLAGRAQQLFHIGAARARRVVVLGIDREAALVDFGQAVMQRVDQFLAPLRVIQHVVLQVGIAAHYPDIAQYLV